MISPESERRAWLWRTRLREPRTPSSSKATDTTRSGRASERLGAASSGAVAVIISLQSLMRLASTSAACVFLAAVALASPSLADEPPSGSSQSKSATITEPAPSPPPTKSYALPLGLSYLALPALAGAAAAAYPDDNATQAQKLAVGVILLGVAAPATVHLAYGKPVRALISPLGAIGSIVLGGLLVGGPTLGCHQTGDNSSCFDQRMGALFVGVVLGYAGWAIYDTVANSSVVVEPPAKTPTVSVSPTVSRGSLGFSAIGTF